MNRDIRVFSTGSKVLHWLIALMVVVMLICSFFLEDLPDSMQSLGYMIHKSIGLTVLFLMVIRIGWIYHRGKPSLPLSVPRWEVIFSRMVQYAFYVLLLAMPLCGWIMSVASNHTPDYFGLFRMPIPGIMPNEWLADVMKDTHNIIAWLLIGLLFLHVAGALKHHWINKDNVLRKMWFGGK